MGISSAFVNSSSGLSATARWAELTAENIANANREGFSRRSLITQSSAAGGVLVTGADREVNSNLDRIFRLEASTLSRQGIIETELTTYSHQLGNPGDTNTISNQLSNFYSSFSLLSNAPADVSVQRGVLNSATGLVGSINATSNTLAQTLTNVELGIQSDVQTLNERLEGIANLNKQISASQSQTAQRAELLDRQSEEIDALSQLIDINITTDGLGNTNITTGGGTELVENDLAFNVSYNSTLGQLSVEGTDITPNQSGVRGFSQGQIAGRFELRNEIIPQSQLQLDEFARALIQGFEASDTSLPAGQAGLFTDLGVAYDPAQLEGLAGRISINDTVDPNNGGNLWHLRDGIGATTEGAASDSTQILQFLNVFETVQNFDTQAGQGDSVELLNFISGIVADQKLVRVNAQENAEALNVRTQAVQSSRQAIQGVNLDEELQQLIIIEQSYAANSQVLQSLTEMLDTLLASV